MSGQLIRKIETRLRRKPDDGAPHERASNTTRRTRWTPTEQSAQRNQTCSAATGSTWRSPTWSCPACVFGCSARVSVHHFCCCTVSVFALPPGHPLFPNSLATAFTSLTFLVMVYRTQSPTDLARPADLLLSWSGTFSTPWICTRRPS